MKKILAKIILISLFFGNFNFLFLNQVSATNAGDILITEVYYDVKAGNLENEGEWFELYNPTSTSISLSGWTIEDLKNSGGSLVLGNTYTFTGGVNIAPGDFLLVGNDATEFTDIYPGLSLDIDMQKSDAAGCKTDNECLQLNNGGGDALTLKDDSGNIIDHMAWEGVDGFSVNADESFSACRRNLNDTDTDAEWANNCESTPGTGTFVTKFPGGVPVASLLWSKTDSESYSNLNTITTLHDRSGNDRDGTANNTPSFDTINTFNFYPTISFDGSSDGIDFPKYSMPIGDKNYTIFTVFKTDLSQNGTLAYVGRDSGTNKNTQLKIMSDGSLRDLFDNGSSNRNITPGGTISANVPSLVSFNYNTDNNEKNIFLNGKNVGTKNPIDDHNASNTSTSDRGIGFNADGDNSYLKGNIAEILAYDSELNSTDRQKIDSYLALKYGITFDQTTAYNYINSSGSVLWDSTVNSSYTHDIIGIGQNNLSDLDQKISHSINLGGILTISTSNDFVSLNTDASRVSLDDGKFLIIGNNSENVSTGSIEFDSNTIESRINREWKVANTGSVGNVFLKFDGFNEDYIFLKDSDGDFSSGATNVGNLNSSGEISTTLSDGEYFTLAKPITNNTPTDITLSNDDIDENNIVGDIIGNLSTTDTDIGDSHIYSFTGAGNDNASFTLSGSQILAGESFDFETSPNSYTIRILTDDQNGGTFEKDFIIIINDLDDESPVVTLSGTTIMDVLLNSTYNEDGAFWTDNVDGSGVINSASSGSVDIATIGTYNLEYTYIDTASNSGNIVSRTVNVISGDTPIITLNGDNTITQEVGTSYTDQGAEYSDTEDGTGSLTASGIVDNSTVGSYILTYDYTDTQGNVAIQVTRTINIVDTTKPVITLIDGDLNILVNDVFIEPGNSCTDNYDTTCSVIISGDTVDTTIAGSYVIKYNITDSNGNIAEEKVRTVNVTIGNAPVITLIGDNPQILDYGYGNYVELGASSTDIEDGNIVVQIDTSNLNIEITGNYNVIYTVTDSQGNTTSKIRVVKVEDNLPPVITINGNNTESYYVGENYIESGATCIDGYDTSCNVVITGEVNTDIIGEYILTYTATDEAGNSSTKTRTINIKRKGGGGGSHNAKHMDVCNETGGDFSGDYYDGKCGENPNKDKEENEGENKKEETKKLEENKEEKVEKIIEKEKIEEGEKEIIFESEEKIVYKAVINGKEIEYAVRNIKSCKMVPNILKTLNILYENNPDLEKLTKLKDLSDAELKREILSLELNGIVSGDDNKNFNANKTITRAEFLKIVLLSHCYEYENSDPSDLKYTDLDKSTWQAKVAKKATEIGLIHGYDDGTVKMDSVISKAEAFKILYNLRILEITSGRIETLNYTDIPVKWEEELVKNLETLGIIDSNFDKNIFHPGDGVDREFMVNYLIRTIKLY